MHTFDKCHGPLPSPAPRGVLAPDAREGAPNRIRTDPKIKEQTWLLVTFVENIAPSSKARSPVRSVLVTSCFLLLVRMLLVAMPGASSSFLAPTPPARARAREKVLVAFFASIFIYILIKFYLLLLLVRHLLLEAMHLFLVAYCF